MILGVLLTIIGMVTHFHGYGECIEIYWIFWGSLRVLHFIILCVVAYFYGSATVDFKSIARCL